MKRRVIVAALLSLTGCRGEPDDHRDQRGDPKPATALRRSCRSCRVSPTAMDELRDSIGRSTIHRDDPTSASSRSSSDARRHSRPARGLPGDARDLGATGSRSRRRPRCVAARPGARRRSTVRRCARRARARHAATRQRRRSDRARRSDRRSRSRRCAARERSGRARPNASRSRSASRARARRQVRRGARADREGGRGWCATTRRRCSRGSTSSGAGSTSRKASIASGARVLQASRARMPGSLETIVHLAQTMIATGDTAAAKRLVAAALDDRSHPVDRRARRRARPRP